MIVPAILTDKRDEFKNMLNICSEFADCVQIDIMDGKFVPSKSIAQEDLKGIQLAIKSEAHLMVNDPLKWVDAFKEFGSERIIFHFEIDADHKEIIAKIKEKGLEAGLALNPPTKLKNIEHLCQDIDFVLFMSVNPGFYGAPFIPSVLDKIKEFKKLYPHKLTGIDGGVKLDNLKQVISSGVDYICIGSALLKAKDPKDAFLEFSNLSKQTK